jgi:hypothetical protein
MKKVETKKAASFEAAFFIKFNRILKIKLDALR